MKETSKKTKQMGIHDRKTAPYNKSKELHKSSPTRAPERNKETKPKKEHTPANGKQKCHDCAATHQ
jgi:hypothetical protein